MSDAQARMTRKKTTEREKVSIYGFLLPHFSREESDMTPTIGCTINPDSGGAILTSDVWFLACPNFRGWGSKSSHCKEILSQLEREGGSDYKSFPRPMYIYVTVLVFS